MYKKIISTIETNNLITQNDKIIIGLSGGADSVCLTHVLNSLKEKYNLTLIAVHINHGLRIVESERDERFAKEMCENLNIKFFGFKVNVKEFALENKITEEEAGRIVRYLSFEKVRKKESGTKIAVAHNKNDQAETVLMRIIRGTGLKGLGGIPYKNKYVIRPVLDLSRKEIENYCDENNISHITDSTNKEVIYTRNKIRLETIPYIEKEFNPKFVNALINLSDLSREEEKYLNNLAKESYTKIVKLENGKFYLNIENLLVEDDVIKRRVIRLALENFSFHLKDINNFHIGYVLNLLNKKTGKEINLPNNIVVRKEYNNLIISNEAEKDFSFSYELQFNKKIYVKEINKYISLTFEKENSDNEMTNVYTKAFSYDKIKNVVQIRSMKSGDMIKFLYGTKKIKDFFSDKKVPLHERNTISLITDGSNIICIIQKTIIESDFYLFKKYNNNEKSFFIQIWEDEICHERKNNSNDNC